MSLRGTAQWQGVRAPAQLFIDREGRFALQLGGELPMARGFDGQRAWALDYNEAARTLRLREAQEVQLLAAALGGKVLAPDASPDSSQAPFTVALEPSTGNPKTITVQRGTETQIIELSAWRSFQGRCAPSRLYFKGPTELSLQLHRHSLARPTDFLASGADPAQPTARFDAALSPELAVRKTKTGHLLVQPRLNGRDLGWFIFDTGAGITVLNQRTADALQLRPFGQVQAVGNGGSETARFVRPARLQLGPLTLDRPFAIVLDLVGIEAALGEPLAGIVGFDAIHRSVVQLDAGAGSVALYDPAQFSGSVTWQAMKLLDRRPVIEAEFEGKSGWFMLDSGAGHTFVSFSPAAVERFKLMEGRALRDSQSAGVGGARPEKRGTLQNFVIGGRRLTGVPAQFKLPSDGPTGDADPSTVGVIGGGLLRLHQLTLDYTNERIALVFKPPVAPPAPKAPTAPTAASAPKAP